MSETVLFKLDGYENPKNLVLDFWNLVQKEGAEAVLKQGRFKLNRENWVAGMTCIGMTKLTRRAWFVKASDPKEETPDFRATAFDTVKDGKHLVWNEVECEIVDCPKNLIPDNCREPERIVFEHIKKTKLWKAYPKNFVLIIYSRFTWKQFSLEKLSEFFCKCNPNLFEVWDLMSISETGDQHLLAKLFPNRLDVEINRLDINISER
jgi:hypothetical protein